LYTFAIIIVFALGSNKRILSFSMIYLFWARVTCFFCWCNKCTWSNSLCL